MNWQDILTASAVKATIILAAAAGASALLRGKSAALRHYLWTAALAALLLLPLAIAVSPEWIPPTAVIVISEPVTVLASAPVAPHAAAFNWSALILMAWGSGCLLTAAWFLVGIVRTAWMVRRATPAVYAEAPVRVVESAHVPVPLAWGIFRPVIVLPSGAAEWPPARLHTVLLHELMHIERRDLAAQLLAQVVCVLYWFHPLSWVALAQLRKERERACDDAVLLRGVAAHDYAGHLVDLVRVAAERRQAWTNAPAMAERSDLESRVRALLDRGRNRRPLSVWPALSVTAAVLALLVSVGGFMARAQSGGTLSGTVTDPSGARVPTCEVVVKHADGIHEETGKCDPAGQYRVPVAVSGHYTVEIRTPGFKLQKLETELVAGAEARVDGRLEVGQISQTVTVTGRAGVPTAAPQARQAARPAERIRVGGSITPARLVRQPRPVYSEELKAAGVEGTVMIKAIISKEGKLISPRVVNSVDPRLAQAALDAIADWLYEPTRLNGEPVEVLTSIDIAFQLEK